MSPKNINLCKEMRVDVMFVDAVVVIVVVVVVCRQPFIFAT